MCEICVASNVFPICSSVYMNQTMIDNLNKLGIKTIKIERDFDVLKKMKIYNLKENVFGIKKCNKCSQHNNIDTSLF